MDSDLFAIAADLLTAAAWFRASRRPHVSRRLVARAAELLGGRAQVPRPRVTLPAAA